MNRIRPILLWLVTAVLCLGLLVPLSASAADLHFTSINDSLAPLTSGTMPVWTGGMLYVPYTVFDAATSPTGVDLGLHASYNRKSNEVVLYKPRKMLVFNLTDGTCRDDMTGEVISAKASVRNGQPYLPLKTVCDFFGLTYSYISIRQGYLVRIKSDDVVLSDSKFIDAAGDLINLRLREYNQSITPVQPSTSQSSTPPEEVEVPVSSTDVRTYLAFRCTSGEGVADILAALDAGGVFGLFFFSPQTLEAEGSLVRRILGTGHSIGILAEGEDLEQTLTILEAGRRYLERTAHLRTTLACVPKGQQDQTESQGWVCWQETLSLSPSSNVSAAFFASNTLDRLEGRARSTYVTLSGGPDTARVLPTLLRQLKNHHFVVSIPTELRL